MAILNGPYASKMRGRIGEVVAAKTVGGQTALRSYQPNVKNPKTRRQRAARGKFADLSGLAALFANAVAIGYGKAVQGMKMYARNLFLRDCYAQDMLYSGGVVEYDQVKVSKKAGLSAMPIGASCTYAQATGITCSLGAGTPSDTDDGVALGAVFVLVNPDTNEAIIAADSVVNAQTSGIVLAPGRFTAGSTYYVYVFLKEMEFSGTEIATDVYPWKYPSNTGDSVYVGTVSAQ